MRAGLNCTTSMVPISSALNLKPSAPCPQCSVRLPLWARRVLDTAPEERSPADCRRLHALLRGSRTLEKFTEQIQLALCRAFTYLRSVRENTCLGTGQTRRMNVSFTSSVQRYFSVENLVLFLVLSPRFLTSSLTPLWRGSPHLKPFFRLSSHLTLHLSVQGSHLSPDLLCLSAGWALTSPLTPLCRVLTPLPSLQGGVSPHPSPLSAGWVRTASCCGRVTWVTASTCSTRAPCSSTSRRLMRSDDASLRPTRCCGVETRSGSVSRVTRSQEGDKVTRGRQGHKRATRSQEGDKVTRGRQGHKGATRSCPWSLVSRGECSGSHAGSQSSGRKAFGVPGMVIQRGRESPPPHRPKQTLDLPEQKPPSVKASTFPRQTPEKRDSPQVLFLPDLE